MEFTIFTYVALFIATYLLMKHIIHRFKNYPPSPPFSLPIIGHLYLLKRPFHRALVQISARYGPILYLQLGSRPTLVISSPSAVEECFLRSDAFVDRPHLLPGKFQMFNCTTIPWAPYGAYWHNLRRIAAVEILSPQRLQILSGNRAHAIQSFISRLMKDCIIQGEPIEMKSPLFRLTLDNMMRNLVGLSCYDEQDDHHKGSSETKLGFKSFQEVVEETFQRNGISNMEDFLPVLKLLRWRSSAAIKLMKKLNGERETFMRGLMENHRERDKEGKLNDAQKKSMLHVLLSLQKEDPKQYCDEMIGSLILTLFFAGTDTTAATIVWTLALLLNHPQVLNKAQHEIDTYVGYNRLVKESDKNDLPYIQCIINEIFRMYPVGPLATPYESRVDCKVAGHNVPRGSMLIYNIWGIHHDPKIWDEPSEFKPERFLGLQETRNECQFIPFGAGKRQCPGEHLATKVVWLTVATLIQCFEWERPGDELVDLTEGGGLSMVKAEPLLAKCRPRSCMMDVLSRLS